MEEKKSSIVGKPGHCVAREELDNNEAKTRPTPLSNEGNSKIRFQHISNMSYMFYFEKCITKTYMLDLSHLVQRLEYFLDCVLFVNIVVVWENAI